MALQMVHPRAHPYILEILRDELLDHVSFHIYCHLKRYLVLLIIEAKPWNISYTAGPLYQETREDFPRGSYLATWGGTFWCGDGADSA